VLDVTDPLLEPCDQLEPAIRAICRGEDPNVPLHDVNLNRANGFAGRIEPLPPLARTVFHNMTFPAPDAPPDAPSLLIRGWNFTTAMARWTLAGMPRRTQAEIDERLAICQDCPNLHDNHCLKCGCACVETNQLMNKLALSTEKCPEGKWV
jgi:hypothetical protein